MFIYTLDLSLTHIVEVFGYVLFRILVLVMKKWIRLQVTVEEENTLVIRSGGKRKREDGEEEGCKYLRLERKAPQKAMRKFRLPENADVSAISAKCESGVLMVVVGKLPPPPKPKTVQVTVA